MFRNAIIFGLAFGLFGALISSGINGIFDVDIETVHAFSDALILSKFTLFGGLVGGGKAVFAHGFLRLILFRSNTIPWNYSEFLDYAASHHLIREVRGGYIVHHRMLMEYFASLKDV